MKVLIISWSQGRFDPISVVLATETERRGLQVPETQFGDIKLHKPPPLTCPEGDVCLLWFGVSAVCVHVVVSLSCVFLTIVL